MLAGEWLDMAPHSDEAVGYGCYAAALAFSQSHLALVSGMVELPLELYRSRLAAVVRPVTLHSVRVEAPRAPHPPAISSPSQHLLDRVITDSAHALPPTSPLPGRS